MQKREDSVCAGPQTREGESDWIVSLAASQKAPYIIKYCATSVLLFCVFVILRIVVWISSQRHNWQLPIKLAIK